MRTSLTIPIAVVLCAIVLAAAPSEALVELALSLTFGLIGVAIALWRARTLDGDAARPWRWFALGGLSSVAFDATETVASDLPVATGVSISHMFGLAMAVFFLIGATQLLNVRRRGYAADVILTASIIAVAPVVLMWELVGASAVGAGLPGATVGVELLRLALYVMVVVTDIAVLHGNRRSTTVWLVGIAGVAFMISTVITVLSLPELATDAAALVLPPAARVVGILGGVAAVSAALHPSAYVLAERGAEEVPLVKLRHVLLLFVFLLALPAGALLGPSTPSDNLAYATIGFVASAVVTWRVIGLLTDRNAMVERFEEMTVSLRRQATSDALTGLPNRHAITTHLDWVLAERRADLRTCAVMFIDLDDFKLVNDSLGHEAGDDLLRLVAERLRASAERPVHVGRFGGDEFVVVVPVVKNADDARQHAARILDALNLVTVVRGHEVQVKPSLGLTLSGGGDETSDSMLRDADAAMYAAKRSTSPVVFDSALHEAALDTLGLEQQLRHALDHGEIQTAFQPKMCVESHRPIAVEALARWRTIEGQMIPPDTFIPIAESSGLIHRLGRHITELACAQMVVWRQAGHDVPMSINVSAAELVRPDYPATLAEILSRFAVPPHMITLELTERDMGDVQAVSDAIARLRADGVAISIDDFGTGFFSLTHLRHLPVDEVKIDRGFVDGVERDSRDRAVVKAIIELAAGLDLRVVAEGVETEDQAAVLRTLGCPVAQGYLWYPPLEPAAVTAALQGPAAGMADPRLAARPSEV